MVIADGCCRDPDVRNCLCHNPPMGAKVNHMVACCFRCSHRRKNIVMHALDLSGGISSRHQRSKTKK